MFIFVSSNIIATTRPSSELRHFWYLLLPTISAACFHSSLAGTQWLKMPNLTPRFWMTSRSLASTSCACLLAVSIDCVRSWVVAMDSGVMTFHMFVATARCRLDVGVSHKVEQQKGRTYWLAPRFMSFCQYSIVRVSARGSWVSPSK